MAALSPDRVTAGAQRGVLTPITLGLLASLLWLVWQAIRLPILTLLVLFEPIVNFALSAIALLVALTAFFWKFADSNPGFPFWTVLAASLACVLLLALYDGLIQCKRTSAYRYRSERR